MQDIIDVGGNDQALDRKAHLRRDVSGKDITEIAGRHRIGDLAIRRPQLQRAGEVIDHLRHQPRPVDRIDRAEVERRRDVAIVEHPLHMGLRVVEAAFDRKIVDIGRAHRGHLAALDITDPGLWDGA